MNSAASPDCSEPQLAEVRLKCEQARSKDVSWSFDSACSLFEPVFDRRRGSLASVNRWNLWNDLEPDAVG